MSETFSASYSGVIPAYAYRQYAADENVQAFFSSLNTIQQGILTWFADTPLAVYTSPAISGPLLDWTLAGIYGIARPILTTLTINTVGPFGTEVLGTHTFGTLSTTEYGTAVTVNDDIYKRVATWILYRGDGLQFSMPWLLRRVERFLNGSNGGDVPIDQANVPLIVVVAYNFTILVSGDNPVGPIFQQLIAQGFLPTPLPYTFTVQAQGQGLANDGGIVQVTDGTGWPTSPTGLAAGALWDDGGVAAIAGSPTPSGTPPLYFGLLSASTLLMLGGANLPLTNPHVANQLWNDGGVLAISSG